MQDPVLAVAGVHARHQGGPAARRDLGHEPRGVGQVLRAGGELQEAELGVDGLGFERAEGKLRLRQRAQAAPGDGFGVAVVDEEDVGALGVAVVAPHPGSVPFPVRGELGCDEVAGFGRAERCGVCGREVEGSECGHECCERLGRGWGDDLHFKGAGGFDMGDEDIAVVLLGGGGGSGGGFCG